MLMSNAVCAGRLPPSGTQRQLGECADRVSGVDPVRYPESGPDRLPAVAQPIAVFDVVVDERVVVEQFDGGARGERALGRTSKRSRCRDHKLGPQPFAAPRRRWRIEREMVSDLSSDRIARYLAGQKVVEVLFEELERLRVPDALSPHEA